MSNDDYNGWSNRETWAVKLYLDNDEGLQNRTAELAANFDNDHAYELGAALRDLAESLWTADGYEEYTGERMPIGVQREAEDIGSLCRVNWVEIARAYIEDLEG